MSEIITDKLTGKASAGDVTITSEGGSATMQLQQSLAKAWANYEANPAGFRDSFNSASLTDNGTGDFTTAFTNAMSNDDYAFISSSSDGNSSGTNFSLDAHTFTTSSVRADSFFNNASSCGQQDNNFNHLAIHGDLA